MVASLSLLCQGVRRMRKVWSMSVSDPCMGSSQEQNGLSSRDSAQWGHKLMTLSGLRLDLLVGSSVQIQDHCLRSHQ